VKIRTVEIPIPSDTVRRSKGERVRKEMSAVEFGGSNRCFEYLASRPWTGSRRADPRGGSRDRGRGGGRAPPAGIFVEVGRPQDAARVESISNGTFILSCRNRWV